MARAILPRRAPRAIEEETDSPPRRRSTLPPLPKHGDSRADESGQAIVELALIAPLLFFILMGILDLGRSFYTYEALANTAREGARYCALNPGVSPSARITSEVSGTGIVVAEYRVNGTVSANCPAASSSGSPVTVTVSAVFDPITLFFQQSTIGASSTMVMW